MKKNALQMTIAIALLPAAGAVAQNICANSNKLACAFPASGNILATQTLGTLPGGASAAPAAQDAAFTSALTINAAVAAQLTQLPVPSSTVGVISIKKKGSEIPASFHNLGPVLTDRPDTVGQGHIFAGFNFQHFNFNALDGTSLGSIPVAFAATDKAGTPDPRIRYGSMINKTSFSLDQYVLISTVGVTPRTDLSVIVPVNTVKMTVVSSHFSYYDFDIATNTYSSHVNNTSSVLSSGNVTGLGDVTLGLKQLLVGQDHNRPAAAAGATFRFPTGNSMNYLGSGAMGGSLYGLIEYRARVTPHFKISYVWNNSSKILNLTNKPGVNTRLPGGIQYAAGTDVEVFKPLTLNFDVLGSQFANSPYFTTNNQNQFVPIPPATSGVPPTYQTVTAITNTYTTVNVSGGVKYSPFPSFLVYVNALIQTNNVGLRSDVVPSFGVAYNFSTRRTK